MTILIQNWRVSMHSPWYEIGLALVAVICGYIVGAERQRKEKPAGMRTLTLVCLGSAAFTMASYAFGTTTGDTGRVAAQIVTGIGFLGAGVIMRGRGIISGATTAATIWATAAIGMIVGAGFAAGGLGLAILVRLVLTGINLLEIRTLGKIKPIPVALDFDPDHGRTRVRLERILGDFNVGEEHAGWSHMEDGSGLSRLTLSLRLQKHHLLEMLDEMISETSVKAVHNLPEVAKQEAPPKQVF